MKSVSSILKASSAASTKKIEDIIDNIKKQSKLIQEAIKSTMEVFKRNKGMAEKFSDVAEVSDGIEEVSANSEEVLVTMDEFTHHISNLRDIPSHLKSETDKLKVEGYENILKKRSWNEIDDFQLPKNNPTPEFGIIQIQSRIFIFFKIKCELC